MTQSLESNVKLLVEVDEGSASREGIKVKKFYTNKVNSIKISNDKNGRSLAHLWNYEAMRWIRISVIEAELAFVSDDLMVERVA